MKNIRLHLIIILFFIPVLVSGKGEKASFGEIKVIDGNLVVNLRLIDFLNEEVFRGIRKGMTAGIEFHVQLWQDRRRWADKLIEEKYSRMKVSFDNWERRYLLSLPKTKPVLLNEERIKESCSQLVDLPLAPVEKFNPEHKYAITVRVILQPLSVENYQEIRQWLAGEVKELDPKSIKPSASSGKKAGNWFLGLILNLTGFGDRVTSVKSRKFQVVTDTVVYEKKD
jgi:hypothetical protein